MQPKIVVIYMEQRSDIAYNKYSPITRSVRDDTLKWILSEVLNDLRKQGRCHIKYEKHQGCFHITIR